jgi:MFS family permease
MLYYGRGPTSTIFEMEGAAARGFRAVGYGSVINVQPDNVRGDTHAATGKGLFCAITALFWFAQYVYIPFLTPYLFTLSLTATAVGIVVGAYGVTQLVLRIPLGVVIGIVRNHRFFILTGSLLAGVSSVGMMISPSPLLLCVANGLSGVASSTWISFTVLYPSYYPETESTRAIGIINVFANIGRLTAFVVGGILVEKVGIRGLFVASFISGTVGTVLSFFIDQEKETTRVDINVGGLVGVMREGRLLFASIMAALMYLILFATVFSFTTSTAKNLGASGMEIALCSVLFSGAGIVGSYLVGSRIVRNIGERNVLLLSFLLIGLYCAGIAFSPSIVPFYPLQIVAGLANGVIGSSLMAYAVRHVDKERKSTAMGFYQSVYCLGITFGPVVMGLLVDHSSVRMAFIVMAFVAAGCAAAVLPFHRAR